MILTPDHTSARVTKESVKRVDRLHGLMKLNDVRVKKYQLWDEAVRLLELSLLDESGKLK